jgi:hypothetical protein
VPEMQVDTLTVDLSEDADLAAAAESEESADEERDAGDNGDGYGAEAGLGWPT